jgi:acetylornithine/succinyldiaminopimelate/putrescine aminotransferase
MLGVEFDFDVVHFVKDDYRQTYFTEMQITKLTAILPPLTITKPAIDLFIKAFTRSFSRDSIT